MFKYGQPVDVKYIQPTTRNIFYSQNLDTSIKDYIDEQLDENITNKVNNYFTSNVTNIFDNDTFIENIENTIVNNENITNIIQEISIPPDLLINSIGLLSTETDRVRMIDNTHFNQQLIVGNVGSFPSLTNYINYKMLIDGSIYLTNKITIKDKDLEVKGNELFFDNNRIKDIDNDEIYNNITSWNLDENDNTYTYSNVGINTSDTSSYTLNVNGDTNISGDIVLQDNTITVIDDNLYFNNRLVSCCEYAGIQFYFQVDYDLIDIEQLEQDLIAILQGLGIDTTYITFNFVSSCIRVDVNIRNDILLNPKYIDSIIAEINKIYNLVVSGQVILNLNEEYITAIPNIYLLNHYYYFNKLSPANAFKLVKRNDEDNNKGIRNGYEVYLKNINDEYLLKDYTFGKTGDKLLLKVHAYKNSFLSDNDDHCISLDDEFKLEILLGIYAEEICPSDMASDMASDCYLNPIINGDDFNEDTFIEDALWTNIGINPTNLTEEVLLSTNIEDYIENPDIYNEVYLIDNRWLTYVEGEGFGQTYNNNAETSKVFTSGLKFNNIQNKPDYVFTDTYQIESIDNHSKFMYNKKHLPGVQSVNNNNNIKNEELLLELEKAHIYIDELNNRIKKLENIINKYNYKNK